MKEHSLKPYLIEVNFNLGPFLTQSNTFLKLKVDTNHKLISHFCSLSAHPSSSHVGVEKSHDDNFSFG